MDERTAAQFVALSVMVQALVESHPNHDALRLALTQCIERVKNHDDALQPLIDEAVLNWMNGLRKQISNRSQ
jgi:hypothetical protein